MCLRIPINIFIHSMSKGDKKFIKKTKTFGTYCLFKDIEYVSDDDEYHLLDIYSPVLNHENGGLILYIHGGAYVYGKKEYQTVFSSWFANQGFQVITPNYRLINNGEDVDVIAQVQDIFKVLDFIEENRLLYHFNTDKLCLLGDSAGGHIALMVDLILHSKELQDKFSIKRVPNIKVNCVALNSTMYDFSSLMKIAKKYLSKKDIKKLFSKHCFEEDYMDEVSPRTYIKDGYKTSPLFASSAYKDMFLDQTLKLKRDAEKYNLDAQFLIETTSDKRIGHVYNHFVYDNEGLKCNNAIVSFFKKHANIE